MLRLVILFVLVLIMFNFLSMLNSFLGKQRNEIEPIKLEREAIRALGSKASRMNIVFSD